MKISAVKIYNIRSFKDKDNYLIFEDDKTAIIGVNESGKSNILEAIGKLNFTSVLDNSYNYIKNLSTPDEEVKILVELYMSKKEMQQLGVSDDSKKTLMTFRVGKATTISGTLSCAIAQNQVVKNALNYFESHKLGEIYSITNDNRDKYNSALHMIKQCSQEIIPLSVLDMFMRNFIKDVDTKECVEAVENLKKLLTEIYNMFPIILYKQWNGVIPVKAAYVSSDAIKELSDTNSSLYKLTRAADIQIDEMKKAFELPEGNTRNTIRFKIENAIRKNICDEFKNFYSKNDLDIIVKFESNKLFVNVVTGEMVMSIGERSNGLRWYLGLFIELLAMEYRDRNIIYLLDEPGVFLHVNAQKELLSLFDQLCDNESQVVYTTHLPYMLDTENIYCIRRVEKDDEGQSHIYNRVYSGGLELPSRQETLTPLIQAMGCDLKYSTDISSRLNVITEGITDRMYLEAGMHALNITENVNIIPSNGAAAIPNIISILIGWGCDYKIILDFDSEGFTQYNRLLKNFGEEIEEKIIFVVDGDVPSNVNDKTVDTKTIENLLSEKDMNKLDTPYDGTDQTKTISAMEFRSKIIQKDILIDDYTYNSYKCLFEKMGFAIS